jgi:carbamoyl-phosphate synthase large subunit
MIYRKVLVTGCEGDIAVSIANVLRSSAAVEAIIGADCRADAAAVTVYDEVDLLPRAADASYGEAFGELVRRHRPDLIIPMSEAELQFLLDAGSLASFDGAPVLAANAKAIAVGLDKLKTARHLAANGIATPWSGIVGQDKPRDFPCIVKPRRGQGSKSVTIVQLDDYPAVERTRAGDLFQQLLPNGDEEHTCGVYGAASGEVRTIAFRRKLRGGLTGSAEVVANPAIDALLRGIAEAVELKGSINVQLRMNEGEPVPFEINPRFSSTVEFRHRAGFTDLIWALLESRGLPLDDYSPPEPGLRFERTWRA